MQDLIHEYDDCKWAGTCMVFEITRKANEYDAQPLMKRLHSCPTTQNTKNCFCNSGLGT